MQAIGSKVGDYKLLELLGEGAKSEVFRAKHEVLEEIVALKILRDKEQVERLVHEAKILNKLNHSSIISLKAVSLRSDPPFVAMELIEGQSLRKLLQEKGSLELGAATKIARAILSALEYAHDLGIVHGDLKPENILIDHAQKPYLVDFGFAAVHSESALNISDSMTENTLSYGGTLGYAAPEQLKGEELDGRADLYSLAVVIFEMLTGQRPEPGDKPSDLRPELPAFLDEIFLQCYCRKEKRFSSASEMLLKMSSDDDVNTLPIAGKPVAKPENESKPTIQLGDKTVKDGGDPMIGRHFGTFEILSKLGEGGMGAVYKARHSSLEKIVALKMLHVSTSKSKTKTLESLERFQREAIIAAKLDHPNIVSTIDFGEQDNLFYLVMRYVKGECLDKLLKRDGKMDPGEALVIAKAVASGLAFAHDNDLVHRDIKPANILLSDKKEVLIADFGLAKSTNEGEDIGLTATGMILGTPAYMAPEQCAGESLIDHRADLYSLGLMLYFMVTGVLPVKGNSALQILRHRITVDPSPPRKVAPELGRDLSDFIMSLLVRDRDQRLSDSKEVVAQLTLLCERYPAKGRSQRPPTKRFDGGPKSRVLRRRKAKSGRARKAPLMDQTIPVHQYQQQPEKPKIPVAKKVTGPVFEPLVTLPVDQVGRKIQEAEEELEQGRFDLVQAKIGELELSYGGDERVDDLKAQLQSLQVLVEDNLEQARSRCGKGRHDDAMAFLLAAAQKCPSHPEVMEELRTLEKRLKERDERLIQAEEALKRGQKEEWQRQATDLVASMPKDTRVLEFIEESERFFARIDTLKVKAAEDATAKNFVDAVGRMERALNLSPSDSVLKQLKEQYEREVIRQSNRRFQRKLLVGGGVAFGLCFLMIFLLQRRADHLLARSQVMLDQGHPKTALKDYENALQPFAWLTSATVREELKREIDGHLAYKSLGENIEKPEEKVAALEEFQGKYPGVKTEEIKARLIDSRRDMEADKRFNEICDLDVVEKVKQLRVFLANDKFLRNKQEARQILQSILRRRQAALEKAELAEKNQQWIEARDALKDAVAYGAVEVGERLAKVSQKAEKLDVILIQAAQALARQDYDGAIALYKTAQKLGANVSRQMVDLSIMRYKAEAQKAKYRYDYAALVQAYKNLRDVGGKVKRYDWDYAHEQEARLRAEKHTRAKRYQEAIAAYKEASMFTRRSKQYQYKIGYIERQIKLEAERKARAERYKKRRR